VRRGELVVAQVGQSAGEQANPVGSFSTVTLSLVWERSGWRLDGTAQRPGPTPLVDGQPVVADEFGRALDRFTDWRPA